MAKNGQVQVGPGTFPAGGRVGLHERVGDAKRGHPVKTATVGKDSTAEFTGLCPGGQYYVEGEVDGRTVTIAAVAKVPGEPAPRVVQDPDKVRADLRSRALDQGSTNAPPVEGMRSTSSLKPKPVYDQAARNRETEQSALRTAEALKKADLEGAQIDRAAATAAGIETEVGPSGDARPVEDEAARKRSEAAKKAARTRKRNTAKNARQP